MFISDLRGPRTPARHTASRCCTTAAAAASESHDTDLDEGTALLHRLLAAAERPDGADPASVRRNACATRIDDDLDAPRALEALDDLASAILSTGLSGGGDPDRPGRAPRAGCAPRRSTSTPTLPGRTAVANSGRRSGARSVHWSPPYRRQSHMSEQVTITLPDGSDKELAEGSTAYDVAASIGRRLAKAVVAATVDGELVDLSRPLDHDASVAIVTADSADGREVLRHSTAHVLAQAVIELFPGAKYAIGPAIADGFYYDFELPDGAHFSDDDLERIEARIREIVAADEPFVRDELDPRPRIALFADQPYKSRSSSGSRPSDADDEVGEGNGDRRLPQPTRLRRRRQGRLRRPVPRPARAVDRAARRVQAHQGRGRVLAGRREAPDAAAHLRHRVGIEGRARRAPAPARGGGDGATIASSAPSSTSSRSPTRSAPASRCSTRRAASSAR